VELFFIIIFSICGRRYLLGYFTK